MDFKRIRWLGRALGIAVWVGGSAAWAESPRTIWQFLGIPQAATSSYDATANRSGDRPERERSGPLKRIVDPTNLNSDDLILQKSAEMKRSEDLAPQKIKAVKYVASVGCGCNRGADSVLVAALDDCTEAVRYEAAQAIAANASKKCGKCEQQCCCTDKVMKKLAELAYHRDERGCWKESSPRVRAAAECALLACCPTCGPTPDGNIRDPRDLPPGGNPGSNPTLAPERAGDPAPTPPTTGGESAAQMPSIWYPNAAHRARPQPAAEQIAGRTQGVIASIDPESQVILVTYDQAFTAVVGGEPSVQHGFLWGTQEVAKLRVVRSSAGQAICERVAGTGRLQKGDAVALLIRQSVVAETGLSGSP